MRKIDATKPIPKYHQISRSVLEQIEHGTWQQDERIPSCRELAEYFQTTYMTVTKAMDLLDRGGVIRRVQGKGMFVNPRDRDDVSTLVGVLAQTTGDVYSDMFTSLITHLEGYGLHSIVLSAGDFRQSPIWRKEERVEALLRRKVRALVVDGIWGLGMEALARYAPKVPTWVFVNRFESSIPVAGASFVLSDSCKGGFLAADHLLARGYGRLVFLTYPHPDTVGREGRHPSPAPPLTYQSSVIDGLREALRRRGLDDNRDLAVLLDPSPDRDALLRRHVADGFRGIVCMGDFHAQPAYRLAADMGLQVGRDLGVVGYFDTPIARSMMPSLTSVSIQEERMGDCVGQAVVEGWTDRREWIEPLLRERASTGNSPADASATGAAPTSPVAANGGAEEI